MEETARRRARQLEYNRQHGVVPRTVLKTREEIMQTTLIADMAGKGSAAQAAPDLPGDPAEAVREVERLMLQAAERLEFEEAARLRDLMRKLTDRGRG